MDEQATEKPDAAGADAPEQSRRRRPVVVVLWALLGIGGTALVVGAIGLFGLMVNETQFERPSPEFDAFTAEVDAVASVDVDFTNRWVEAPTFSNPTSYVSLAVDREALPELLDTICDHAYADPVTLGLLVHTASGGQIGAYGVTTDADADCFDPGFELVAVIDELERSAPGAAVQPAIWDNGKFALGPADYEEWTPGFSDLLPLVANAEAVRDAAGLPESLPIEINSMNLGVTIATGESAAYAELLTELADLGVLSVWAELGGQADGVDKVQLTGDAADRAAVERVVRAAPLPIADHPIVWHPQR
jgi:hypothetical protein